MEQPTGGPPWAWDDVGRRGVELGPAAAAALRRRIARLAEDPEAGVLVKIASGAPGFACASWVGGAVLCGFFVVAEGAGNWTIRRVCWLRGRSDEAEAWAFAERILGEPLPAEARQAV